MGPTQTIDWDYVSSKAEAIVQESDAVFDKNTLKNTYDFAVACREICATPIDVAKGYWNTISISWPHIEVEIFEDRYELYLFSNKKAGVTYFPRTPGQAVPEELVSQLARLISVTPRNS